MVSKLDRSAKLSLSVLGLVCCGAAFYWGYQTWHRQTMARREAQLRQDCERAMKAEKWAELETYATTWLDLDKKNGFAWLYLGEAAQRQGDYELAAECLGSLDESDPKCIPALLELVEMHFGKFNRPLEAVKICNRIIELNPDIPQSHQRLTFFYAMTLQRREMIRTIRRAIELNAAEPEAYAYLVLAGKLRFTNGYQVNSHWLKSDPDNEHFQVAQAIFLTMIDDDTDPSKAEGTDSPSLIDACCERFPDNVEILAYLLDQHVTAGDTDAVAELLSSAPAAAELDGRFWRHKGWYHGVVNELEQAEAAYRESLKWDPYDWQSRHELAGILRRRQHLDEVDELTELALEGKQIQQALLALPSTAEVTVDLASRIADFAAAIDDGLVAERIRASLEVSD